jgi:hypothetical protein
MSEQTIQLSSRLLEVGHLIQSDLFKQRIAGKTRGPAPALSDKYSPCHVQFDPSPQKAPTFDFDRNDAFMTSASLEESFQKNAVFGPLFYLVDGTVFIGQMDREQRQGRGLLIKTVAPCLLYEGYFKDDLPHFKGKIYFDNGDFYVGEFEQGKMQGQGTYYSGFGKSTFRGRFAGDLMEGEGEEHWSDGTLYRGSFAKGMKHGRGILISNQHTYEGEFSQGHFSGHGSFKLPNRMNFIGQWKESQLQSPATITYPDGRKYDGEVDQDLLPTGRGTIQTQHKKCTGTFDRGLLEGKAEILDLHSGELKFGDFRAGRLEAWVLKEETPPIQTPPKPTPAMANPTTIETGLQPAKPDIDEKREEKTNDKPQQTVGKQIEKRRGCCIC